MNKDFEIIALYLPQYHPTDDNNRWWGEGFTEWTNVGKAKPLFNGHYQPRVPADLGYYDLRLPETREKQAELAKEARVSAFCYYHYWFGNGKRELERPFNEVLQSKKPDLPFCLCWANQSWHNKFWNTDGTIEKKLLIEQCYPGIEDIITHFYTLLPAFKDKRYHKIDNRNFFMIYDPMNHPEMRNFITKWRELAAKENIADFYFVAHWQNELTPEIIQRLTDYGFDKINYCGLWEAPGRLSRFRDEGKSVIRLAYRKVKDIIESRILRNFKYFRYKDIYPFFLDGSETDEMIIPTIIPNWDHSPRSGKSAYIIGDSSPNLFKNHLLDTLKMISGKKNNIIILKSWNEWGEGNYVEPDLKWGKGYLNVLQECLK